MLKINTVAEIVRASELYRICEEAGLGLELEQSSWGFAELLFGDVNYEEGEYRRLNRTEVEWYEEELESLVQRNLNINETYLLYLRCMIAIQKALKEAGVNEYILVEIGI